MAYMDPPTSHRHGAIPAAPYSMRPPSPPSIVIPAPTLHSANEHIKIVPTYEKVDPASLSIDDLKIITQNYKEQLAQDSALNWAYENRRVAQPILDFLYLGPSSIARDRQWLLKTGITMLLAARDSQMAVMHLMAPSKVAQELGIQLECVDVSGYNELIRAFPSAVRTINDHMLNVFRGQRISNTQMQVEDGKMAIPHEKFQRGKVLVFCETGNDRSASVVVAYLMSVFGMSMIESCQFVHFKRFCVSLNDDLRFVLKSYEDLLSAQRTVHRHELDCRSTQTNGASSNVQKLKRGIEATFDEDEEMGESGESIALDHDRFLDRERFVPFVDMVDEDMEEESS
ncbi:phosphatases II [Daldinia loculata]|uniref:phosphatases II n=1 Tax=Daldinia loculata TaxID=103429 RepID=UPI0020C2C921|nr:phosphatases II [Daldinia loculata]KAI1650475.1 phosphatases II [Daldinia loculata]